MRAPTLRGFLCWIMVAILPASMAAQALPDQSGGAILHTEGEVWVNGYEVHDASAVFPGDLIETKPGAAAKLSLDGSTVLIGPETLGKFQADLFELNHGVVSVVTTKSFKVRVCCVRVVPLVDDWTQYAVSDVNGSIQVSAQKKDVYVEIERGRGKPTVENENPQRASVHEGEQKNYDESQTCGAPPTNSPVSGMNWKWIAAGGTGGGLLLCLVLHCFGGGGQKTVSPANP